MVAQEHIDQLLEVAAVAVQLKQEVKVLNPLVVLVMEEVAVQQVMVHQTILLFQIQPTLAVAVAEVVQAQVEVCLADLRDLVAVAAVAQLPVVVDKQDRLILAVEVAQVQLLVAVDQADLESL